MTAVLSAEASIFLYPSAQKHSEFSTLGPETPETSLGLNSPCSTPSDESDVSAEQPSGLPDYLERKKENGIELRQDAALVDLAGPVLKTMHRSSERHKPCVRNLMPSYADRCETLNWLIQAFDVMHFSAGLLFDTVLLLDRHWGALPDREISRVAQRNLLAAVSLALKMGSHEEQHHPVRTILTHLSRDQIPLREVFAAETQMLQKLQFCARTATSYDFLEALSMRLALPGRTERNRCKHLAEFLLQLSFIDVHLHYRYSHSVLAAASLVLALFASDAPEADYEALLEDLELCSAESEMDQLVPCCADLHLCWVEAKEGNKFLDKCYVQHLNAKYSYPSHGWVATIAPPDAMTVASVLMPALQR